MFPRFATARRFSLFLIALISLNQPAMAVSVIQIEVKDYYGAGQYSDPYTFNVFFDEKDVFYDENVAFYDSVRGAQVVQPFAGEIAFWNVALPLEEGSRISIGNPSGGGFWPISFDLNWLVEPDLDRYWLSGGTGFKQNDRSPPNLLVDGSWQAEPTNENNTDNAQLLFSELYSYYDDGVLVDYYDYDVHHYWAITGVEIATVPQVPEPATWALMLLGFGAVGLAIRRRRAKLPIEGVQSAPLAQA